MPPLTVVDFTKPMPLANHLFSTTFSSNGEKSLVTHAVREGAERNTGSSIEAENLGHVVGHSLQVLLGVQITDLRAGLHHDAGQPPLTPANQDPSVPTCWPLENCLASSPKYQTLPCSSCANQS